MNTPSKSFRPLLIFVLTWTVAVPILFITLLGAAQFILLLAASENLGHAALFGVREASLPQATRTSVLAAVDRHINNDRIRKSISAVQVDLNDGPFNGIGLEQNPIAQYRRPTAGDEISVTLLVDPAAAVPDLIGWTGLSFAHRSLVIRRTERMR